jgi:hypothetical protein
MIKQSPDWQSPVLRRAHRLAGMPVTEIKSVVLSYGSTADLLVLGACEAICRTRRESDKVRVMQKNIKRLKKELRHEH